MADLTVVILAGVLGTRLRPVIGELPKVLAPIQDIPVLEYLHNWLNGSLGSVDFDILISTGFLSGLVHEYEQKCGLGYKCIAEDCEWIH